MEQLYFLRLLAFGFKLPSLSLSCVSLQWSVYTDMKLV